MDTVSSTLHSDGSITHEYVERKDYTYVMDYQVDENTFVQISVSSFAISWMNNPEEELKELLDFYRTVEDPLIVVDQEAPVTIVP